MAAGTWERRQLVIRPDGAWGSCPASSDIVLHGQALRDYPDVIRVRGVYSAKSYPVEQTVAKTAGARGTPVPGQSPSSWSLKSRSDQPADVRIRP